MCIFSVAASLERCSSPHEPAGSAGEVLRAFFLLGISSFGGPIAHLGYFRREFVDRRRLGQRRGIRRSARAVPVPAGPGFQPDGVLPRAAARRLARRTSRLVRLHPASAVLMFLAGHWVRRRCRAIRSRTGRLARLAARGRRRGRSGGVADGAQPLPGPGPRRIAALLATGIALAAARHRRPDPWSCCSARLFGLTIPAGSRPPCLERLRPGKIRRTASHPDRYASSWPSFGRGVSGARKPAGSLCSPPFIAPARWCSAAATWSCRC